MRKAVAAGATGIELDVHCTLDGHLVVCHDAEVDRTTNGSGSISSMTLEEVQSLDNAYWFIEGTEAERGRPESDYILRGRAPSDHELRIPTLAEVLEAFPDTVLNLDIKSGPPDVPPYEQAIYDVLVDHDHLDKVIVASFNDESTARFHAIAPQVAISAGMIATANFWQAVQSGSEIPTLPHQALQVPPAAGGQNILTPEFVRAAHSRGLAVHAWTINTEEEMRQLVEMGVDGIISDRPTLLRQVLDQLGVAWDGTDET
jgi:glycerophosphoryl diester phosphodiesterase